MEAFKIIKRLASYAVFVFAATLFFKYSVSVALSPYIDMPNAYANASLPFMYVVLSLGITLLFQLLVIGKPRDVESTIYPWLLLVMFAVGLFASVVILGQAIAACMEDPSLNVTYAISGLAPSIVLCLSEIAVGISFLIAARKTSENNRPDDVDGVKMEKED